jgi:preprotein translocase subunit SecG
MGSQTAFGPRGAATVLSKATTIAAVLFMLTSISLGIVKSRQQGGVGESVIERTGTGADVAEESVGEDPGEEDGLVIPPATESGETTE